LPIFLHYETLDVPIDDDYGWNAMHKISNLLGSNKFSENAKYDEDEYTPSFALPKYEKAFDYDKQEYDIENVSYYK